MGLINILDAETSNRIAAGEVVERPSSAVKELLENSLDAGAKNITLEIKGGGRSMVRVTDDGTGFLREDMPKALLRHATSKINSGSSVTGIQTLGFRGEALAAIGSVSRLEIISKSRTETIGTDLTCDENGIVMSDTGCPDGTSVTMRDIYYNTPARYKFLKRDATEGSSCVSAAEKLALSHPEVSFTVISDGTRKFSTSGDGKLFPAIYEIFGREFSKNLIPITNDYEGISVRGYVSATAAPRGSRSMQNFFVNKRYVKSKTVQAALEEAFRSYIPRGKFPAAVIFVFADPENIDVNVHPAKTEIKFSSEQSVFRAVYYAVRNAFEQNITQDTEKDEEILVSSESENQKQDIPENTENINADHTESGQKKDTLSQSASFSELGKRNGYVKHNFSDNPSKELTKRAFEAFKPDIGDENLFPEPLLKVSDSKPANYENRHKEEQVKDIRTGTLGAFVSEMPGAQQTIAEENESWRMIGQAYDSYIFVETEKDVLIIDKHAAHERILYEKLSKTKELQVQTLLAGITVDVGRENAQTLISNKEFLSEKGFDIDDFGGGCIIVRTVPMTLSKLDNLQYILEGFANDISNGNGLDFSERVDRALYTVACKAALKAGIKNPEIDDENIARAVMTDKTLIVCPHGRPFVYKIPKKEIDKHFDR